MNLFTCHKRLHSTESTEDSCDVLYTKTFEINLLSVVKKVYVPQIK